MYCYIILDKTPVFNLISSITVINTALSLNKAPLILELAVISIERHIIGSKSELIFYYRNFIRLKYLDTDVLL